MAGPVYHNNILAELNIFGGWCMTKTGRQVYISCHHMYVYRVTVLSKILKKQISFRGFIFFFPFVELY